MSLSDYENSYEKRLEEAVAADLSDLEFNDCVSVYRSARKGDVAVVVITPKLGAFENNEASLKRIFQLMIRRMDAIVEEPFAVVYSHMTPVSASSQKLLLLKYFKILPLDYHKNMKRLFILHHQLNLDVSSFFSLTKNAIYDISPSFYKKIVLVSSMAHLQGMIAPAIIPFSHKLHRMDDQILGFTFKTEKSNQPPSIEQFPSLQETFVPFLGTTYLLFSCVKFLRDRNVFAKQGIFRNSANDAELTTAKIRLQRFNYTAINTSTLKSELQKQHPSVDFNYYEDHSNKSSPGGIGGSSSSISGGVSGQDVLVCKNIRIGGSPFKQSYNNIVEVQSNFDANAKSSSSKDTLSAAQQIASCVYVTDLDVVANIIKFSLRSFVEPLVTFDAFDEILVLTTKCLSGRMIQSEWLQEVLQVIERMDDEHYSTFQHLFVFLAEVAKNQSENLMSPSNLGTTFAPSIMRSRPNSLAFGGGGGGGGVESSAKSVSSSSTIGSDADVLNVANQAANDTNTAAVENPLASSDSNIPPVEPPPPPPSPPSPEDIESAYLHELAVSAFVVKGLIEHFVFLLDLKILDSGQGEVIITDNIGSSIKADSVVTYYEKEILWTENIVTKSDRIEAFKM